MKRLLICLSMFALVLILSGSGCTVDTTSTTNTTSTTHVTKHPTAKPTVKPATKPTPKPIPRPMPKTSPIALHPTPTTAPVKPTPTHCVGIYNNPWCYDFNPGHTITIPPSGFCSYFPCIATFYASDDPGDGYIVQCNDGLFSQSGGESGACSGHSGVGRTLYSH